MTEETQDWLNQNIPNYISLSIEEKEEIMQFSLLWSFFEFQVLDNSASSHSIHRKVIFLTNQGVLDSQDFVVYRDYFSRRYIENGNPNDRFPHLHLRDNDNPSLIERVLKNETSEVADIVTALLIIVYRYRNNFFHGYKWAYGFQEQLDNFRISNELLIQMLELQKNIE